MRRSRTCQKWSAPHGEGPHPLVGSRVDDEKAGTRLIHMPEEDSIGRVHGRFESPGGGDFPVGGEPALLSPDNPGKHSPGASSAQELPGPKLKAEISVVWSLLSCASSQLPSRYPKLSERLKDSLNTVVPVSAGIYRALRQLRANHSAELIRLMTTLRRVPAKRLPKLLDDYQLYVCEYEDCPVTVEERERVLGTMDWGVFTTAARLAADPAMSEQAIVERLEELAGFGPLEFAMCHRLGEYAGSYPSPLWFVKLAAVAVNNPAGGAYNAERGTALAEKQRPRPQNSNKFPTESRSFCLTCWRTVPQWFQADHAQRRLAI